MVEYHYIEYDDRKYWAIINYSDDSIKRIGNTSLKNEFHVDSSYLKHFKSNNKRTIKESYYFDSTDNPIEVLYF